jgi:ATP-dependent Clp protease, protease subunit
VSAKGNSSSPFQCLKTCTVTVNANAVCGVIHGMAIELPNATMRAASISLLHDGQVQDGQSVDLMGYLSRQRIIYVGDRITDTIATNICAQLLALEAIDPETEIQMYINSGGGIPYAINAIVDTMAAVSCPVSTVAVGACMTQSALILAAGTKGRRFAMPNARIMMHQPAGGTEGTTHEVSIQATELNRTMRVAQAMFADFTGMPLERVEEETDRTSFMGPKRAQELGLIDGVIQ